MALWSKLRASIISRQLRPPHQHTTQIFELQALEERILFGLNKNFWPGYDSFTAPPPLAPGDTSPPTPDPSGNPPPTSNNPDNKCCCCDGNDSAYLNFGSSTDATPAASTGDPIRLFDGMPLIGSTDLESTGLGASFGVSRSWTGLNESGPVGNGWSIAELPYLAVGGSTQMFPSSSESSGGSGPSDAYIALVEGGNSVITFPLPDANPNSNIYSTLAPRGNLPLSLKTVPASGSNPQTMQLTDAAGDVITFNDVYRLQDTQTHSRPAPLVNPSASGTYASGITAFGSSYGQFTGYTGANGVTVQVSYDPTTQGQSDQTMYLTRHDPTSGASERYAYHYGAVTNTNSGATTNLVTSIDLQQLVGGQWITLRTASYVYYRGDGYDTTSPIPKQVNLADGRLGDLELVTVTDPAGNVITQDYYRYYKFTGESNMVNNAPVISVGPTNNPNTTGGGSPLEAAYSDNGPNYARDGTNAANLGAPDALVASGLRIVVSGASFDRMVAANPNFRSAADQTLLPFVNNYFTYERWGDSVGADGFSGNLNNTQSQPTDFPGQGFGAAGYNGDSNIHWRLDTHESTRYRVVDEVSQGDGSSSATNGLGATRYEYAANYGGTEANMYGDPGALGYNVINYNTWAMKTTQYLEGDGPTPSDVVTDAATDPTTSGSGASWGTHPK